MKDEDSADGGTDTGPCEWRLTPYDHTVLLLLLTGANESSPPYRRPSRLELTN